MYHLSVHLDVQLSVFNMFFNIKLIITYNNSFVLH